MFVDNAGRSRQPNALTQVTLKLAVTQDRCGDSRDAARGHKVAERHSIFDSHAASVAACDSPFQINKCSAKKPAVLPDLVYRNRHSRSTS